MPGRRAAPGPTYWEVEIYERQDGVQPAESFFRRLDEAVFNRLQAFIDNIAVDPVRFPRGLAWQPLSGIALGCHEVRIPVGDQLYRVFVRLDSGPFPGFPRLRRFVLLDGQSKPMGTGLPPVVYEDVARMASDYLRTRKVSLPAMEE